MDIVSWWMTGDTRWIAVAVLGGLALLLLAVLVRSLIELVRYGFRNYLKSSFRCEGETVRLVAVLLLVGVACAMAFTGAGGIRLFGP